MDAAGMTALTFAAHSIKVNSIKVIYATPRGPNEVRCLRLLEGRGSRLSAPVV